MDANTVPGNDEIVTMSSAELESLAQVLDVRRRIAEAEAALLVQRVEATGMHTVDGHRRVASWGRAACNWSGADAARLTKLGRAMAAMPHFADEALAGRIGVAQMHAIAAIAANPRVAGHLAEADPIFTSFAAEHDFDDLVTFLQHWQELADADGARSRHDRAAAQRRADITILGERSYLEAAGTALDGVMMREVFDRFRDIEWRNEWDDGVAQHGDRMHPGLMPRTAAQRNFDALRRLFDAAAGSAAAGGDVTVNLLVDQTTFERHLEEALGGDPVPRAPADAASRRCESDRGDVVDPRALVAAAMVGHVRRMVLSADGVVLDLGRRRRLFTGPLREAVLLSARRCVWRGCDRPAAASQADHVVPHGRHGSTDIRNGGPLCAHHNVWKNHGYRTVRDEQGMWHTLRPDGSEIGWPVLRYRHDSLPQEVAAA